MGLDREQHARFLDGYERSRIHSCQRGAQREGRSAKSTSRSWFEFVDPSLYRASSIAPKAYLLFSFSLTAPTTYKLRPFTPQEDSQILALQPDQLHNSSKKPSINWELATQQFVARLKFELKERRVQLLAMEKRKLKTVEREKKSE